MRKLSDIRAEVNTAIYSPAFTAVLDGIELDVCMKMTNLLVNVYQPINWDAEDRSLDQLQYQLSGATYSTRIMPMEICDPDSNSDAEYHVQNIRIRDHSKRHVTDRISQLLGCEAYNFRMCKGAESAKSAIANCTNVKECRAALFAASLSKLYPYLPYLCGRSIQVTGAEFKRLVSRTLQLVRVSAEYRRANGWSRQCDRSFYGSYAILALPEIFDSQRVEIITSQILEFEIRPPPASIEELKAAIVAAER